MPTTIIHKIGSGVPDATDLVVGEIAQDENTGTLYVKKKTKVTPVGSAGAGMVISATEPSDPVTVCSGLTLVVMSLTCGSLTKTSGSSSPQAKPAAAVTPLTRASSSARG